MSMQLHQVFELSSDRRSIDPEKGVRTFILQHDGGMIKMLINIKMK